MNLAHIENSDRDGEWIVDGDRSLKGEESVTELGSETELDRYGSQRERERVILINKSLSNFFNETNIF
jgi:hypothetical protein